MKVYKKIDYNMARAKELLKRQYPNEVHNAGGDCANPKCDYQFTDGDRKDIDYNYGYFTCPKCGTTHNYMDYGDEPGGWTHSGLSLDEMGSIGERLVDRIGKIPGVGQVTESFTHDKKHPVDAHIGPYAVEIKTNHSQAQPRFKMSGKAQVRQDKIDYANQNGMKPGLLGVRLNFHNDNADLYFRPAYTDTWIGHPELQHIGTYDFSDLNPYKHPEDVPPASELPEDDEDDLGIPKASWYVPEMDAPTYSGSDNETPYWAFRWGYYKGKFEFEDQAYNNNTHYDMAWKFGMDPWREDETMDDPWTELSKSAWFGYGVLDIQNGNVIVEPSSLDFGDQDNTPPIILELIKEKLQTNGFSVKHVDFGSVGVE